jgi:hypothetical protein
LHCLIFFGIIPKDQNLIRVVCLAKGAHAPGPKSLAKLAGLFEDGFPFGDIFNSKTNEYVCHFSLLIKLGITREDMGYPFTNCAIPNE